MPKKSKAQLQAAIRQQGQVQLPPGVSSQKERHASGWVYVFRHTELGQLGRILLQGRADGQTQVTSELAGEPDDPMTQKRAAIFKPLALELTKRMGAVLGDAGSGGWGDPPPRPPGTPITIPCEHVRCERCQAHVAMLIFAEQATDQGGLEDAARLMYPTMQAVERAHLGDRDADRGRAVTGAAGSDSESLAGAGTGAPAASGGIQSHDRTARPNPLRLGFLLTLEPASFQPDGRMRTGVLFRLLTPVRVSCGLDRWSGKNAIDDNVEAFGRERLRMGIMSILGSIWQGRKREARKECSGSCIHIGTVFCLW